MKEVNELIARLDLDPNQKAELKDQMREVCAKLGPKGIIVIKSLCKQVNLKISHMKEFSDSQEEALSCMERGLL